MQSFRKQVDELLENVEESTPFVITISLIDQDQKRSRTKCIVNEWAYEDLDGTRDQISKILFEIKVNHDEFEEGLKDPETSEAFSMW
jgi:hypothetical protein